MKQDNNKKDEEIKKMKIRNDLKEMREENCEFEDDSMDVDENINNCDFLQIISTCDFEEIIVSNDFKFENNVLGLDRDCYLSIVKFLDSPLLRKV
jgi:hypothetical protein